MLTFRVFLQIVLTSYADLAIIATLLNRNWPSEQQQTKGARDGY
jgi:hypothetical protein